DVSASIVNAEKNVIQAIARDITEMKSFQERLPALHTCSIKLNLANDIEDILETTLQTIERIFEFDFAGISTIEGDEIRYIGAVNNMMSGDLRIPIQGSIMGKVIQTMKPQLISDIQDEPEYYKIHDEKDISAKMRSELAVPVIVENELVWVINLEDEEVIAYTPLDQELLEILAMHVSSSIIRLQKNSEEDCPDVTVEQLAPPVKFLSR
ncbi:MAG TPA: GAF domain-containing protein, partial [Patescibacteria group bacterium]|nr:GAF domain-containing protein [Patescibacteria group bacterium]